MQKIFPFMKSKDKKEEKEYVDQNYVISNRCPIN